MAIRNVQRSLRYATIGRKLKKLDMKDVRSKYTEIYWRHSIRTNIRFMNDYASLCFKNGIISLLYYFQLWEQRLEAATQQHGISFSTFRESLTRCNILLNRKVLTDLAIWEPRSFKSLTDIACARAKQDHLKSVINVEVPNTILTKGLIK